jgi:RNA polymerase sigma-70 factor, ECF subfamily
MTSETVTVETLAEQLAPALLTYFTRRVPDPADAADLLADTFLVLWRRADDIPADPQQARMWAYGVARRALSTHRRGGARRTALAARLRAELETTRCAGSSDTPSHDAVHAAIATLHPLDQEIVRLVHWDEFSLAEVAQLLGKRAGTVRSRYHRARQRLRDQVGADRET